MCGITGIVSQTTNNLLDILFPALNYSIRRGPDGFGVGLVNPYNGDVSSKRLIRVGYSQRDLEQKKAMFFNEIESDAHNKRAKIALEQSKYSTRTNKQKVDRKALQINMQPTHLHYDKLEERINDCIAVHNGEIEDRNIRRRINPKSNNKANVDSRFLAEIYYQKIREFKDIWKAAEWVMLNVKGAFSFGFSSGDDLIFFKDKLGIRPLCLGEKGNSIVLTSESGFFNDAYINYIREIKNGEMVKIDRYGNIESKILVEAEPRHCGFEDIYFKDYFSRDFTGMHSCGNDLRFKVGEELSKLYKKIIKDIDLIVYAPESGKSYAQGFAFESGIPYKEGIRKIESERYFLIRKGHKYSIDELEIKDNNIAVNDDSIVRSDTVIQLYYSLKKNGVNKVKFFIAWPPIIHPCNLGIDTPTFDELFAYQLVEDGIIKTTTEGVEYDIHEVNKEITNRIREKMKGDPEYNDVNVNDLEIYFGTPQILEKILPYKTCKQCFTGINPFKGESNFFDKNLERKAILE